MRAFILETDEEGSRQVILPIKEEVDSAGDVVYYTVDEDGNSIDTLLDLKVPKALEYGRYLTAIRP
jgi:hypothetical protein